ncbi:MAG: 4-alpha-glucanotransferase [Geobacter sp.]|nr:4-alpha-glucanotransferase [Geobacter sp.]
MTCKRRSGILLHPTSLPGPGGTGSLGREAFEFVDFLARAGQSLWQVLPLGPTGHGSSPYSCYSAFAGNPLLIDLRGLAEDGDIAEGEIRGDFPAQTVDFPAMELYKTDLLKKGAASFFANASLERKREFWHFSDTTFWLHDYALFRALHDHFKGKSWREWPSAVALREPAALKEYSQKLGVRIGEQKYLQWQFFRQWRRLKEYANSSGVRIIGDAPIFVAYDSADVWCNRGMFHLDEKGVPTVVAGVPPDYFSKTGQLWGNPLYRWDRMAEDRFSWWIARIRNDLQLYDLVRIDHFRGFEAYWEVPAGEKTAVKGRWVKGPGDVLFEAIRLELGSIPIIAEDLGVITPEVEALRDRYALPGMKILQFAFGSGPANPYLPHNHVPHAVVYTGTHDNDTTVGWFSALSAKEKKTVLKYLGTSGDDIAWDLIRTAMGSVACMAVIPLQDVLALGGEARMNRPGTVGSNWGWRFAAGSLGDKHAERMRGLAEMYGRIPEK